MEDDRFTVCWSLLSNSVSQLCVQVTQPCVTPCDPWTAARQVPLSMRFSRQEYWRGLPFPFPGDRPNPGVEPRSLTLQVDSLPSEPPGDQLYYRYTYTSSLLSCPPTTSFRQGVWGGSVLAEDP